MFLPHLVRLVEMHYVLQHVTKLFMLTNCHLYIVSTMVPGVLLILWMIDGIILGDTSCEYVSSKVEGQEFDELKHNEDYEDIMAQFKYYPYEARFLRAYFLF